MVITRRGALIGSLSTLFAAPAIVRVTSIMPVSGKAVWDGSVTTHMISANDVLSFYDCTLVNVGGYPIKIGPDMMLLPGERRVMGGGCYPLTTS